MLHITAGTASMPSAWFIHRPMQPVRGLYGPVFLTQQVGFRMQKTLAGFNNYHLRYITEHIQVDSEFPSPYFLTGVICVQFTDFG